MPELFTGQPSWLTILCLALAACYAAGLYFRDTKNEFPGYLKLILAFARFITIFLISFLLLAPFIRSIAKEKEKPVIIIAVDNSQSLLLTKDSAYYNSEIPSEIDALAGKLEERGEVRRYIFGDRMEQTDAQKKFEGSLDFKEKTTDIANLLAELGNIYANMNVGALIIASDGIYNAGKNPVYQAKNSPYPIYTVAFGDTSIRMDLVAARVNYNRMVYLNNKFPLEVVVRAASAEGAKSRVRISQQGNTVYTEEFTVDKNDYTHSFLAVLEARQSGLQKYSVSIEAVDGEFSTSNNRKDVFVEVLDAKSKILILTGAPHPDISALQQAITSNINYEVEVALADEFTGKVESYSMVILHQLPSRERPADGLLREISDKQVPALFILGSQSDLVRFNQWKSGLNIIASKPSFEEAVPTLNPGFSAFSLTESTRAWLNDLPPLVTPLGDYQVSNASRVLVSQRIGSIETSRPLILFNETFEGRKGVVAGEGLWKWRMYNYAATKDHQAFNELVNKMVQYLSLKDQKKNLRIYNQTNFRETDPVVFDAEVYDESYELTVAPEVELIIKNEEANQFPFVFNKSGNSYHLDAGAFPPGNYSYRAETDLGGKILSEEGQFSISAIDLEALNTVADHHLLYQLAEESGGAMFYPAETGRLAQSILDREDIRPVTYTRKKYEDLLNKGWLFALITGLLALEWFLRKRAGSY
jgi:hypothetical protein